MAKKKEYIISGVSFPKNILIQIDRDRGPIPRSRFLLKLIEIAYKTNTIKSRAIFMIIKPKNISSDVCPVRLASDKIKIIHKEIPHEYS